MFNTIAIGSDHAGFELKGKIIHHLAVTDHKVLDLGTFDKTSCDYPLMAQDVAKLVSSGEADCGILICGTGQGMAIAANKIKGVRAVCVENTFSARATRSHNNANILCLGERVLGEFIALDIIDNWLNTPFEGGRHQVRVDMFE